MAKIVKGFEFNKTNIPKYPWDEWLDGRVWRLEPGTDFNIDIHNMRANVYIAAKRNGKKASVHIDNGESLVIQAHANGHN